MNCFVRWHGIAVVGILLLAAFHIASSQTGLSTSLGYLNNWLLFPTGGSGMGLILALAVPIESVHHDVALAYNFEANYGLPSNATSLTELMDQYGYRRSHGDQRKARSLGTLRDLGRAEVYALLQGSIARSSLPGRACLLRAVCEAAEWPMGEGLLAHVLHVLLTPSSSTDPDVSPEFHAAERRGRRGADCGQRYQECGVSLLGVLTQQ